MNENIINNLGILARYYKKINDTWRTQAYQRAIVSVKGLDFKITDISQIQKVRGIGKSTLSKIKEYLDTGQIRKVEEVRGQLQDAVHKNKKQRILEKFQAIWGVGPARARDLYIAGMRSLDDVKENTQLLTANQRIGLKYYDDLLQPIPREYIKVFQMAMRVCLTREFGQTYKMKIAGSYRRGEDVSGDVDCLITSTEFDLEQMVEALQRWGIVTDILSMRNEKFMGIAHCPSGQWYHFRMDIEFLPEDEWGSGLLYFTGSKGFNVAMRMDAKKKGYTLNQHGLFTKNGDRVPVFSEKEIMNKLGMRYVPPTRRQGFPDIVCNC